MTSAALRQDEDQAPVAAAARAALYLRVSTGRQAESDLSIPDQRRQIEGYCLAHGWEVAAEFVEAARAIARAWLAEVAQGRDPSLSRAQDKAAPTFDTLCDRYLSDHADVRKKASSAEGDRRLVRLHLRPALGSKKVAAITRADAAGLHHKLRATPYEANRVLALASKMFALSERWGMRADGSNPAKNIDRYREEKRERYLTSAEVAGLWKVLHSDAAAAKASPAAIAAIKLLMLTGRHLNEVLGLKWAWVDLDAKQLRLPDTKNGALLVSLADAAVTILTELKENAGDHAYVIPGAVKGKPLVNLQKPWRALRELAGLDDVRIHDLRHTFASVGAARPSPQAWRGSNSLQRLHAPARLVPVLLYGGAWPLSFFRFGLSGGGDRSGAIRPNYYGSRGRRRLGHASRTRPANGAPQGWGSTPRVVTAGDRGISKARFFTPRDCRRLPLFARHGS